MDIDKILRIISTVVDIILAFLVASFIRFVAIFIGMLTHRNTHGNIVLICVFLFLLIPVPTKKYDSL